MQWQYLLCSTECKKYKNAAIWYSWEIFTLNKLAQDLKYQFCVFTGQKMKFSTKVSSVNVTKSTASCGFGNIYRRNL